MIHGFVLVVCFWTIVLRADAFFFSSVPVAEECLWLPWEYTACTKEGDRYLKLEKRKKIALQGRAACSSVMESRRLKSCTISEFITSTILNSIKNREKGRDRSLCNTCDYRTFEPTPPPLCAKTFVDLSSGVQMLGADCVKRRTRSVRAMHLIKSRQKRQFGGTVPSLEHRDILFLLDESGSVTQKNFDKELEFVKVLSEKFSYPRHINRKATRVAVTTFASDHKHHIDLLDSASLRDFKLGLKGIKYRGGLTCLIDALKAARTQVFTKSGGSRVPSGVADGLIILVTDGCFNCYGGDLRTALRAERDELESIGVTVVSFMINVDGNCLISLRALQDGSSCLRGFSYPSWAKFDDQIQDFRNMPGVIAQWTKEDEACP